jgi:hypothetical protein
MSRLWNNLRKQLKVTAFGSDEFRSYIRGPFVHGEAGSSFLGFADGHKYLAAVLFVTLGLPVLAALQIQNWHLSFLALLPAYLILGNLVEFLMHRYPMHQEVRGLRFLMAHVTVHHNFFSERYLSARIPEDYFAIFLPLPYFFFVSLLIMLQGLLIGLIGGADQAWFYVVIAQSYYALYELIHFACHANENSKVLQVPGIKVLRRLHLAHHQPTQMRTCNFNVCFPLWDWICGTLQTKNSRP